MLYSFGSLVCFIIVLVVIVVSGIHGCLDVCWTNKIHYMTIFLMYKAHRVIRHNWFGVVIWLLWSIHLCFCMCVGYLVCLNAVLGQLYICFYGSVPWQPHFSLLVVMVTTLNLTRLLPLATSVGKETCLLPLATSKIIIFVIHIPLDLFPWLQGWFSCPWQQDFNLSCNWDRSVVHQSICLFLCIYVYWLLGSLTFQ